MVMLEMFTFPWKEVLEEAVDLPLSAFMIKEMLRMPWMLLMVVPMMDAI